MKLSLMFMVFWWFITGILISTINHEIGDQIVNRLVFTGVLQIFICVPLTLRGWLRWGV